MLCRALLSYWNTVLDTCQGCLQHLTVTTYGLVPAAMVCLKHPRPARLINLVINWQGARGRRAHLVLLGCGLLDIPGAHGRPLSLLQASAVSLGLPCKKGQELGHFTVM